MALETKGTRVAFIGTGVMGRSMASNLMKAGCVLSVYNRTKEKAEALVSAGARWAATPAEAVRDARVVFTIVGFPTDVEEVYFGAEGILAAVPADSFVVDMTTSRPDLAVTIHEKAAGRNVAALDAPVSGGDTGARDAKLSIMVGGDRKAFEELLPFFRAMGTNIVYQGPAGSGQHTKLCNQIAIAGTLLGVCEAVAYAERSGLDPRVVLESIGAGAAASWQLSNNGPKMMDRDYSAGFYVKHYLKDLRIASESARAMGLEAPALDLVREMFERLVREGRGEEGTQALYRLFGQ